MDLYRLQVHGYSCLVGGGCAAGFKFNFNAALRPQRPQGVLGTGSLGCPPRLSHCSSSMLLCVHRPQGLLGTGAQDVHLDFHTAAELCCSWVVYWLYCLSPPSPLPPPSAAKSTEKGRYAQKVIATVAVVVCSFLQCKLVCLFLNSCCRENFAWAK